MVKSVIYTCKDVTREVVDEEEDITIVGVHVCTAPYSTLTTQAKHVLTHLAVQYLGTEKAPLYLLHWFPQEHKVDLSFGEVGSERQVAELRSTVESASLPPFLRACASSFAARTSDTALTCSVADLEYESIACLEQGEHTVALGAGVVMDVSKQTELTSFLRICER
jgi:hypothetical protein